MSALPEKRGPKIGDAASLWNFAPAPGWTRGEVNTLRLCLMKFGVGAWGSILETGLLPGKLIQQLSSQTQRLLGQQSLAAFTGLSVDVDRVRIDNEARSDVQRKSGLIIWTGPNPTKEMKAEWRREAEARYALTEADLREVDRQLEEIAAQLAGTSGGAPGAGVAAPRHGAAPRQPPVALMGLDAQATTREQHLQLLHTLHSQLDDAMHELLSAVPELRPQWDQLLRQAQEGQLLGGGETRLDGGGEPDSGAVLDQGTTARCTEDGSCAAAATRPAAAQEGGSGRDGNGDDSRATRPGGRACGKRSGRARHSGAVEGPTHTSLSAARRPTRLRVRSEGSGGDDAPADVRAAVMEADIAQVMEMGFSRRKAADALAETCGDVAGAIHFLLATCT